MAASRGGEFLSRIEAAVCSGLSPLRKVQKRASAINQPHLPAFSTVPTYVAAVEL